MNKHTDIYSRVRNQFGATAENYVTSKSHSQGFDLKLLLDAAEPMDGVKALDIATGGGHTAIGLARRGAKVTATDLTPEILDAARRNAESQNVSLRYKQCAAESLEFDSNSFNLVSCRIAPHHFADPQAFVKEVARVLIPGGRFFLIDNIAPEDAVMAKAMNAIEARRDTSHVEAYSISRWVTFLTNANLELCGLQRWTKSKDFRQWAAVSEMDEVSRDALEEEIRGLNSNITDYLDVKIEQGRLVSLSHEAALFTCLNTR